MEEYLHKTLIDVAAPDMTFEELYYYMNELIAKKGFLNLDFLGNLGHSIVKNKNDRIYTYKYDWYQGTKLISSDETLTLPNNGSFDESGVYKLVVSAILKDEFVNVSLEDKTKASSSAEIYFELDFVKNKVTNVILPSSDTLSTVYDNREHINDWSVTVE